MIWKVIRLYELPEGCVVSQQLDRALKHRTILSVTINAHPHKFAFFNRDIGDYEPALQGAQILGCRAVSSRIQLDFTGKRLMFWDGARIYYRPEPMPRDKHQLFLQLDDGSCLRVGVEMYGGIELWFDGDEDNFYIQRAKTAPNPLTNAFTYAYYDTLYDPESLSLSLKAFLATQQRIPGLGNGVLQDILFQAKLHPKRKVLTLREQERHDLYDAIVKTIREMRDQGGRDTERDLYGQNGGYVTLATRYQKQLRCSCCGGELSKESYMGGAIYYCGACQKIT